MLFIAPIISFFGGIFFYRYFFVGKLQPTPNSEILGTNTKSTNIFHQFLVNPALLRFRHDGILLSFEKVRRRRLIVKNKQTGYYSVADQYATFGINRNLASMKSKGFSGLALKRVESTLNDPKPLILTHWIETNEKDHTVRYNAYQNIKDRDYDLPKAMLQQYESIAALVKSKLQTDNYTHLVIACSGWNNYQGDSADLYEKWVKFTKDAASNDGRANDFRPFLIGFTWASRWITPGISLLNKANDADELGITHVNVLVWKYIMPSLNKIEVPVVTIGHSFGARVMSRANHSRFMQEEVDKSFWIDKAIDFQGAYPTSRFCENKGSNGGLYTADIPIRRHFMTYSVFDHALEVASKVATYIGNDKSFQILQNNEVAKDNFEFTSVSDTGEFNSYTGYKPKILVDAKNIVKTIFTKAAGAHNDVRDKEAGRFIWEVLKK